MSRAKFSRDSRALPFRRSTLCLALWAGFASVAGAQEQTAGDTSPSAAQGQAGDAEIDSALDEILGGDIGSEASAEASAAPATAADTASPPDATPPAQADAAVPAPAQGEESFEELETIPVLTREQQSPQPLPQPAYRAQIEEIVVTATKREQSVRDIPMTVNVLSGDKLASQGARELQDFVDQVPGLQMQDVAVTSSRKVVIRGIAPDNTTNQTVGTVLGDVPLGDAIGSFTVVDPDTWDLQTVEVLKGPQGTLFGASSLAGIIRYVPNAPKLDTWEGKAAVEWMSIKDGGAAPTYSGALNVPLGSEVALRLSGTAEHRPGVIDIDNPARQEKDADDAKKWSGRAMLLWEPNDRLTVNAWYMAQERKADEAFFTTDFNYDYTRRDAPTASPTRRYFDLSTLDVRYRFDWATLVSLTAYQNKENKFNFDSSYGLVKQAGMAGIPFGRSKRDVESRGLMQELRLVSPDGGPWTWQGGAFFSTTTADINSDIYFPLAADSALAQVFNLLPAQIRRLALSENGLSLGNQKLSPLDAEEIALFGEVTRELGPVNLTLGARLYKTEVSGRSEVAGLLPFVTNTGLPPAQDLNVAGNGFSPKLALTWQVTDEVMLYGGVSRGFQYGGVNAIAVPAPNSSAPQTYDSSELWSYEAGVRSEWLDRTLRADLTAFYQQWSEAQVSQIAPPAEAYIDNVGEVKVSGIEFSLQYLPPVEGLSLDFSGSYLDSRTAAVFEDSNGEEVPSGTVMPNAPRFQAAAAINYARLFADAWATNTALQYTYSAEAFGNIQHAGRLEERNMLNFNFSVTHTGLSFSPTLGLVVNNLTDQRKVVSATDSPESSEAGVDGSAVGYTRPRTIILRLGVEF